MRISDWSSDVCSSDLGPYAAHADFGDPGFMGTYALNVLDERNWVVVGDRREYRSPPAEAEHLARLDEYHSGRRRSSEVESRSEEHTSELQSLMRISYAVFCLQKKTKNNTNNMTLQ